MDKKELLLTALEQCGSFPIFAGFDGAVDRIYEVVASRTARKTVRMGTIDEFAAAIAAASGRSTNVERVLLEERCGGNAVLCAMALATLGQRITLVANVGEPLHAAFAKLNTDGAEIYATGNPNSTDALEFFDGKIMLTDSKPLALTTYDSICQAIGAESLGPLLARQRAVAFTNWTMTPNGTEIFERICNGDLRSLPPSAPILFDIADPARRADLEILQFLDVLAKFCETHRTYLSLNVKELERIAAIGDCTDGSDWREKMEKLHSRWPLEWVLHRLDGAACYGSCGWCSADGFFTAKPHSTTGGGDHFNGGFVFGLLGGLSIEHALLMGNAVSGAFVRSGRSPDRNSLKAFIVKEMP
ncbi:MAG: PfkB family carbohydrate kinase [Puniceicoccales bacterium]|jgi:sugar/nucleoside kinase (ribokinase family)|nr:PfkB family carbohydrate kinase [Puniceicoccales bacterium]